jgi:hypothetical protein
VVLGDVSAQNNDVEAVVYRFAGSIVTGLQTYASSLAALAHLRHTYLGRLTMRLMSSIRFSISFLSMSHRHFMMLLGGKPAFLWTGLPAIPLIVRFEPVRGSDG